MKIARKAMSLLLVAVMVIGIVAGLGCERVSAATKPEKPVIKLSETDEYGEVLVTIEKTSNADGYRIFYKAEGDKSYTKLCELTKDGTKKRSYIAKNLESGTYSFRARAYSKKSGKKVWGSFSKVVKIEVVDADTRAHDDRMHELASEKYPDLYALVEDGKMGLTMDDSSEFYFTLGSYGMIGNNENHSAKRDIEWIVVDYNEDEGKALLLSRYILEHKHYNNKYEDTDWENCSLRAWLNEEFLYTAFSKKEIDSLILKSEIKNDEKNSAGLNGGNDTKDRVFLLSYSEATGFTRKATRYNGVAEAYWLRSPGRSYDTASYVTDGGVRKLGKYDADYYKGNKSEIYEAYYEGIVNGKTGYVTDTWNRKITFKGKEYIFYALTYKSSYLDRLHNLDVQGVRPAIWINMSQE